ncbi:hypothetical protein TNCV_3554521 [Trichonephila clavipes]|nr:hypothetical protein TNCV_3554521 [Trichonephila clavipes]
MGNERFKRGERESSNRLLLERKPKRPLASDVLQSQRYLGAREVRGIRIEEFRISNRTGEVKPASSPKLGLELTKVNCGPFGISNV